jgi:anaerobic selenocysteine-containing dehydrogenase
LKSVNDTFSDGLLADEILTPGKNKIRGLFVTGGNPLITMANSNRMRKAFQELDLLLTLDIFPNETGSIAHLMLPCTSPLERPDLPFIFPLMLGLQVNPYLQATKAITKPEFEQLDEATICLDLCKSSRLNLFDSAIVQRLFDMMKAHHSRGKKGQPRLPQETILSGLLRITGHGGYKSLLNKPHGKLREDHKPGNFLGE